MQLSLIIVFFLIAYFTKDNSWPDYKVQTTYWDAEDSGTWLQKIVTKCFINGRKTNIKPKFTRAGFEKEGLKTNIK